MEIAAPRLLGERRVALGFALLASAALWLAIIGAACLIW
jgi:hypothetical protein